MSRVIPEPVRAVAGLAATVVDETRRLPSTLPGLPLRVIGVAMQVTMKLQQGYAGLVARGDEVFTGIRGEQEPGLATFDDDVEDDVPPPPAKVPPGFRDSPFDRAAGPAAGEEPALDETPAGELPPDPAADAVVDAATDLADDLVGVQEALDELAIEELVDEGPTADAPAVDDVPVTAEPLAAEPLAAEPVTTDPVAMENALLEGDAADTDTGTATPESPAEDTAIDLPGDAPAADGPGGGEQLDTGLLVTGEDAEPTDEPAGGDELAGSQAAGAAPVDGYDGWSIAQLRGRLRGYDRSTVQGLLAYEEATRARQPYVRMLGNRLDRLGASA